VQNATLGPYNITWAVHDSYGNAGNNTSTTIVIPARFRFLLQSNNATVNSFDNLDLPVTVRYPNGTSLTNFFGNVTANYRNATGDNILTLPLAYNQTNSTWHMFFSTPEEGNVTFSFDASDRFGNSGLATDAFILKINQSSRLVSLRLIIAGVIGALIPIGLLIWAIATISKRRRKYRP
jgi:selenocysteine lyase/cysteine desulfurase